MQNAGRMFSGFLVIGTGMALGKSSEYICRFLIGRFLGPETLGNVTLIFAVLQLLVSLCLLELTSASMHYGCRYVDAARYGDLKRLLFSVISMSTVISLFVSVWLYIGGADSIAIFFNVPNLSLYFKWIALVLIPAVIFNFFFNHLLAMHKRKKVVWVRELLQKGSRVLGLVLIILFAPSLKAVVGVYFLSLALPGVLGILYFIKMLNKDEKNAENIRSSSWRDTLNTIIKYSWPLTLSGLLLSLSSRFDVFSVGYFLSVSELGLYSIAILNSTIFVIAGYMVNEVFLPIGSSLTGQGNKKELALLYKTAVRWSFYVLYPLAILLIARAGTFLKFAFGSGYVDASVAMQILMAGYMVTIIEGPWGAMVLAQELTSLTLIVRPVLVGITILSNILLVPAFGLIGAACAMALSKITVTALRLYLLKKKANIHPLSRELIIFIGFGGSAMVAALWLLTPVTAHLFCGLLIDFCVLVVIAGLVVWKVVGLSESDRAALEVCLKYKTRLYPVR